MVIESICLAHWQFSLQNRIMCLLFFMFSFGTQILVSFFDAIHKKTSDSYIIKHLWFWVILFLLCKMNANILDVNSNSSFWLFKRQRERALDLNTSLTKDVCAAGLHRMCDRTYETRPSSRPNRFALKWKEHSFRWQDKVCKIYSTFFI